MSLIVIVCRLSGYKQRCVRSWMPVRELKPAMIWFRMLYAGRTLVPTWISRAVKPRAR